MLPREKLYQKGAKALSDLELLSILIGTGTKSEGFKSIARKSLREIKKVVDENRILMLRDIISIKGVGLSKASRIIAGIELGKRLYSLDNSLAIVIGTSEQAAKYAETLSNLKQEQVRVLLLDARYRLIEDRLVAFGKVNSVSVEPREILEAALAVNAVNLVLLHNHPTGDATPSQEDIVFTRRIKEACDLLGLKLLDHLVIAKGCWEAVVV
jgi:DNA repair protein RadC